MILEYSHSPTHYISIDVEITESDLILIDKRLADCYGIQAYDAVLSNEDSNVYYFNTVYVFEWLEFIGPVIASPIFVSTIALILNLIVILILKTKKNKKEKLFES